MFSTFYKSVFQTCKFFGVQHFEHSHVSSATLGCSTCSVNIQVTFGNFKYSAYFSVSKEKFKVAGLDCGALMLKSCDLIFKTTITT
jgi:hypothetical protein